MRSIYSTIFLLLLLAGCRLSSEISTPTVEPPQASPTHTLLPSAAPTQPSSDLSAYAFPDSIDPAKRYLFYLHGKIIEDQGLPAISPEFGEYEYEAILERLSGFGFVVLSEQRPKDTDAVEYAGKIAKQVETLLSAGVPAEKITVVGASLGAGIAIFVSDLLENEGVHYVLLAICAPDYVEELLQSKTVLSGNVLSIYDSVDSYAGSCQPLFDFSAGKGLARQEEIVLQVGTGHGVLYQPLDEWILPTIAWAEGKEVR
jgi:hypothetical protein